MESPKAEDTRIMVAIDPILSQIMRALARAKPRDVTEYLRKAWWLYENVDHDVFRNGQEDNESITASDSAIL